jgi:hypothetical protein
MQSIISNGSICHQRLCFRKLFHSSRREVLKWSERGMQAAEYIGQAPSHDVKRVSRIEWTDSVEVQFNQSSQRAITI